MPEIRTETLTLSYTEHGDPEGAPVLLLHGWPDAAVGWGPVIERLAGDRLRLIVPENRGSGGSRFLRAATVRDGQAAALAADVLDLADHLGLERFAVVGHDWGARVAYTLSAVAPERVAVAVTLALGYQPGGRFEVPEDFRQVSNFWYQWLMCLDAGVEKINSDPVGFARAQWDLWSPPGWFDESDFAAATATFGPDWVPITLNAYRARFLPAEPRDERYDPIRDVVARTERLRVPTLMIQGGDDRCDQPSESEGHEDDFDDYRRVVVPGVGHFPHREAPDRVAELVRDWLGVHRWGGR